MEVITSNRDNKKNINIRLITHVKNAIITSVWSVTIEQELNVQRVIHSRLTGTVKKKSAVDVLAQ